MKHVAGLAMVVGGGAGVLYGINPETFAHNLSQISQNQIAQTGFFFTVAAFIHAGRVKAEIRGAFASLTSSIDNLGNTLSKQLSEHSEKLEVHEKALASLSSQVSKLQEVKQGDQT